VFVQNKKVYRIGIAVLCICFAICGVCINSVTVSAEGFLSNGLVSFSPDRTAFTLGYGDKSAEIYPYSRMGDTVTVWGNLGLPQLEAGQHYYDDLIKGDTKVGYWRLSHPKGQCIHSAISNCSVSSLNKMGANRSNCGRSYNAGWLPYCAHCGKCLAYVFFYITEDMARRTAFLPSGSDFSNYFYLCPYDNSLENYSNTNHVCSQISANHYKIIYNANNNRAVGSMQSEWFMFDNIGEYEGEAINAKTTLSKCTYELGEKKFLGWSDRPNGKELVADEDEWLNVQEIFGAASKENGDSIVLYAVWESGEDDEPVPESEKENPVGIELCCEITRDLMIKDSREAFIRGEKGTLDIEVIGYADYVTVEFPAVMEDYNNAYDYTQNREDIKKESISFSIPLVGIPDETECLIVKVTAYKDEKIVCCYPKMILIGGRSIIDEIRTSLR